MTKDIEMPEWLKEKLNNELKLFSKTDSVGKGNYRQSFEKCFEILWPQMELMHAALKEGAFQGVDFGHGPYTSDYVLAARNAIDKLEDMK